MQTMTVGNSDLRVAPLGVGTWAWGDTRYWKGVLPIPGAKDARQAVENAGAIGWQITHDEAETLNQATVGMRK